MRLPTPTSAPVGSGASGVDGFTCTGNASWLAAASRTSPSTVEHRGVLQQYPPLPEDATQFPEAVHALLTDTLAKSREVVQLYEQPSVWRTVARRVYHTGILRVAILRASTLNGCGSRAPSRLCDPGWSWSRRMQDVLQTHLEGTAGFAGVQVRASAYAKNAVAPSFFQRCTRQFLRSDADVVLFETGVNIYDGDVGLTHLVPALRETARHAAMGLVFFVTPEDIQRNLTEGTSLRGLVRAEAASVGADVVDVSRLVEQLKGGSRACNSSTWEWKRTDWFQDHHPSGVGHQLIGEIVAHYIHRRLVTGGMSTNDYDYARATTQSLPPVAAPPWWALGRTEVCLNTADQLPVVHTKGNWTLADEGAKDKGVQKLGWVSRKAGDIIEFGVPPSLQPDTSVWCSTVRFGYLLSSYKGQGTLIIECIGSCGCSIQTGRRKASKHTAELLSPFPRVPTGCSHELQCPPDRNISVTAVTEFTMLHRSANRTADSFPSTTASSHKPSCRLRVRHGPGLTKTHKVISGPSKVRVDTLSWHPQSCDLWAGPKQMLI